MQLPQRAYLLYGEQVTPATRSTRLATKQSLPDQQGFLPKGRHAVRVTSSCKKEQALQWDIDMCAACATLPEPVRQR